MDNQMKYIKHWLFSFFILAIDFIIFMFCFYFERNLLLYIVCALVFAFFCVYYRWSNKKITCKDGYTLMQAYFFYKKCEKNKITTKPQKLNKEQADKILQLAKGYDYAEGFDLNKAKSLYHTGYHVEKLIKQKNKKGN